MSTLRGRRQEEKNDPPVFWAKYETPKSRKCVGAQGVVDSCVCTRQAPRKYTKQAMRHNLVHKLLLLLWRCQ